MFLWPMEVTSTQDQGSSSWLWRCLFCALLLTFTCWSQPGPQFDVAAVKASSSKSAFASLDFRGGQFISRNVTLRDLIGLAYRPNKVRGGPDWMDSTRFDIIAKAEGAGFERRRKMLATLLAERFGLVAHIDQEVQPALALVIAKKGTKFPPVDPTYPVDQGEPVCVGELPPRPSEMQEICRGTMGEFAKYLGTFAPSYIDLPVVDQTGLTGRFELRLHWSPHAHMGSADNTGAASPGGDLTILEALESQLGLKLERRRLPLPVLIVERAQKPTLD
jgi:uncharacterized protein (TIGR03435 family)